MSNAIPESVKQQIVTSAKEFCKKDNRPADVVISHTDYSLSGLMTYHAGAEFGYSLSSKRIEELEKVLQEAATYLDEVQYDKWTPVYKNKIEATSVLHTKMKQVLITKD